MSRKAKTRFGAALAIICTIIAACVGLANLRPHLVVWLGMPEGQQRIESKVDALTTEVKNVRDVLLRNHLANQFEGFETVTMVTNNMEGFQ
jgi:hypothetical protein